METWRLADLPKPSKRAPTVFSCFCGGGGSTMGYMQSGFRSLGGNDIDPRQAALYKNNLSPQHFYRGDIRTLAKKAPKDLYNLDVLDGSPPCSTFSTAGLREHTWGKKKRFREGQKEQVLDTLYFDFLDQAYILQPKIIVTENVTGIVKGKARDYAKAIIEYARNRGFIGHWYLLKGERLGLRQARHRVFFIAYNEKVFQHLPILDFTAYLVPVKAVWLSSCKTVLDDHVALPVSLLGPWKTMTRKSIYGAFSKVMGNNLRFGTKLVDPRAPCPTILASSGVLLIHPTIPRKLSKHELLVNSDWPKDYIFSRGSNNEVKYVVGMSVPPLFTNVIGRALKAQWLKNCK